MKKLLSLVLVLAMLALLAGGCAATSSENDLSKAEGLTEEYQSSLSSPPAVISNAAPAAEFSLRLLSETVATGSDNPVISPLSAYLALSMAADGASGDTLTQFDNLLGLTQENRDELCRSLINSLSKTAGNTAIYLANSAWVDDDSVQVNDSFLQNCVDYYSAEVYTADLPTPEALAAVNAWVNTKTKGMIPTLREETYEENTVFLLLNTVYFQAKWEAPFLAENTAKQDFSCVDGSKIEADFLVDRLCHRAYIKTDRVEGVLLPYDDGRTAFLALRPISGISVDEYAASLTAEKLATYPALAKDTLLNLSLPKCDMTYAFSLNNALQHLGLTDAFDGAKADFSALGSGANGNLYLNQVFQKVKLVVDEAGTEAAAATSVQIGETAAVNADEPVILNLNSPFFYAVMDLDSGLPLFIGIMDNPAK